MSFTPTVITTIDTIKVRHIIAVVCEWYGCSHAELQSPSRKGDICFFRHVAIWLIRKNTRLPLTRIASLFNRKDHATILHAINRIEKMMDFDVAVQHDILEINDLWKPRVRSRMIELSRKTRERRASVA